MQENFTKVQNFIKKAAHDSKNLVIVKHGAGYTVNQYRIDYKEKRYNLSKTNTTLAVFNEARLAILAAAMLVKSRLIEYRQICGYDNRLNIILEDIRRFTPPNTTTKQHRLSNSLAELDNVYHQIGLLEKTVGL